MTRHFIIGDIHGCYDELQELLAAAALSDDDHIISIGDMVNKGPQSHLALDFFRKPPRPNIYAIMGNHEHKHIRAHHTGDAPDLAFLLTRWQLGEDYKEAIQYMAGLPSYLLLPDAVLVHAYVEPGIALEDHPDRILIGTMGANKDMRDDYERPWYTYYDGDKPLIVGHKDWSGQQQPFIYEDKVFGLDTGCVYGGQLTGLLLPEFKFVSVPARRDHWQATKMRYIEG